MGKFRYSTEQRKFSGLTAEINGLTAEKQRKPVDDFDLRLAEVGIKHYRRWGRRRQAPVRVIHSSHRHVTMRGPDRMTSLPWQCAPSQLRDPSGTRRRPGRQ